MAAEDFRVLEEDVKHLTINGETERAIDKYTSFLEREDNERACDDETLALAWNNRGHLRYLTVDFQGAVRDYTAALKLNPNLAVSYYNRGQIHYRLGRFQLAVEDLERALALDPTFVDARQNLDQARQDLAVSSRSDIRKLSQ